MPRRRTHALVDHLRFTRNEWLRALGHFLDALTTSRLVHDLPLDGERSGQSLGSAIERQALFRRER